MSTINEKAFDGKKVRAKGKEYKNCYFDNCTILLDRFTTFYGCCFINVTPKGPIESIYYNFTDSYSLTHNNTVAGDLGGKTYDKIRNYVFGDLIKRTML